MKTYAQIAEEIFEELREDPELQPSYANFMCSWGCHFPEAYRSLFGEYGDIVVKAIVRSLSKQRID